MNKILRLADGPIFVNAASLGKGLPKPLGCPKSCFIEIIEAVPIPLQDLDRLYAYSTRERSESELSQINGKTKAQLVDRHDYDARRM